MSVASVVAYHGPLCWPERRHQYPDLSTSFGPIRCVPGFNWHGHLGSSTVGDAVVPEGGWIILSYHHPFSSLNEVVLRQPVLVAVGLGQEVDDWVVLPFGYQGMLNTVGGSLLRAMCFWPSV